MAVETRPELVGKRFLCLGGGGEEPADSGRWRAGVIRAVSQRDSRSAELAVSGRACGKRGRLGTGPAGTRPPRGGAGTRPGARGPGAGGWGRTGPAPGAAGSAGPNGTAGGARHGSAGQCCPAEPRGCRGQCRGALLGAQPCLAHGVCRMPRNPRIPPPRAPSFVLERM